MNTEVLRRSCRLRAAVTAAALLAFCAVTRAGDDRSDSLGQWTIGASADHHLDALRLGQLGSADVWAQVQARPGSNLAYMLDEVRTTYAQGAWRWSLLTRQRAVAVASEGALDLARATQGAGQLGQGASWSVKLDYLAFAGSGFEVARSWSLGRNWHADLGVQALMLSTVRERHALGQASYSPTDDQYSAKLNSQEVSSRLQYPFQQQYSTRGFAALTSGGVGWSDGRVHAGWRWRDAGRLSWRALPQQALTLSNDMVSVDASGFAVYSPLITGQNSQPRYRRWVAPQQLLDAGCTEPRWGRFNLGADWWSGFGRLLPRVDWQRRFGDADIALGWKVHERRADLGLGLGPWRLDLGGDAGGHSRTISLSWHSAN